MGKTHFGLICITQKLAIALENADSSQTLQRRPYWRCNCNKASIARHAAHHSGVRDSRLIVESEALMFSNFWPVLFYAIPSGCGWISIGSAGSMSLNSRIVSLDLYVNSQTYAYLT